MYLSRDRQLGDAVRGVGLLARVVLTLAGATIVGFGIPAAWLKLGSEIQARSGSGGGLAFLAVAVAFVGIVASYFAIIAVAGLFAARRAGPDAPPPRYNWNRSMRDERHQAPTLNALETLFVVTALLVGAAYMVWFFLFAGSSLPMTSTSFLA